MGPTPIHAPTPETTSDFYEAFMEWAEDEHIYRIPQRNTIKQNLENLHYRVGPDSKGNSTVFGLKVKSEQGGEHF
jgi:hypothetical protein